jgi:hypothetical protein
MWTVAGGKRSAGRRCSAHDTQWSIGYGLGSRFFFEKFGLKVFPLHDPEHSNFASIGRGPLPFQLHTRHLNWISSVKDATSLHWLDSLFVVRW